MNNKLMKVHLMMKDKLNFIGEEINNINLELFLR
jgi:hypothetical protein